MPKECILPINSVTFRIECRLGNYKKDWYPWDRQGYKEDKRCCLLLPDESTKINVFPMVLTLHRGIQELLEV